MQQGRYVAPPEVKAILDKYGNQDVSPLQYETPQAQVIDIQLD